MPLPRHDDDASKDDRGQVLVIGGGRETPGAVLLAGLAALRVGAGRLQLATVTSTAISLAIAVPEARVIGLPETANGELDASGAEQVRELASRADAVLIGPGVLDDVGMDAMLDALATSSATIVVDAGAIPAAARRGRVTERTILVPNAREAELLGEVADAVVSCRAASTTITAPDGRRWIERSGTIALATSGSGDVASGVVAGLAARGASPVTAAIWGAHLHGQAGERIGRIGLIARDLLDQLPLTDQCHASLGRL
jgi:hydroxyethylthiazole kinase-like uncharacterized protein yjeF